MRSLRRPMFKRGGSAQGTGLMSYVETPRIKAQTGYGGIISPDMAAEVARGRPYQAPTSGPIGPQNISRFTRFLNKYPRLAALGTYGAAAGVGAGLGALTDFYARSTKTPEEYRRLKEISSIPFAMDETNLDVGEDLAYIKAGSEIGEAPGFFPRGGKAKYFRDKGLDPKTGLPLTPSQQQIIEDEDDTDTGEFPAVKIQKAKTPQDSDTPPGEKDEPTYDIRTETEKERDTLKALLDDPGLNKAEAALILAEALNTKGGIGQKLKKAGELARPVVAKKRKQDRELTLAAYKIAKQKELEQIKAGKKTGTAKLYEDYSKLSVKKNRTPEEEAYFKALSKNIGSDDKFTQQVLSSAAADIVKDGNRIVTLQKELDDLISKGASQKKIDLKRAEIQKKKDGLQTFINMPGFDTYYPGFRKRIGLAEGGQPEDQMDEAENIIDSTIGAGTADQTQSEPVLELSAKELRDRLPPEISNEVVSLLANNNEALQAFAYIRTQDDVNNFNARYGVNLVIPPERA